MRRGGDWFGIHLAPRKRGFSEGYGNKNVMTISYLVFSIVFLTSQERVHDKKNVENGINKQDAPVTTLLKGKTFSDAPFDCSENNAP